MQHDSSRSLVYKMHTACRLEARELCCLPPNSKPKLGGACVTFLRSSCVRAIDFQVQLCLVWHPLHRSRNFVAQPHIRDNDRDNSNANKTAQHALHMGQADRIWTKAKTGTYRISKRSSRQFERALSGLFASFTTDSSGSSISPKKSNETIRRGKWVLAGRKRRAAHFSEIMGIFISTRKQFFKLLPSSLDCWPNILNVPSEKLGSVDEVGHEKCNLSIRLALWFLLQ